MANVETTIVAIMLMVLLGYFLKRIDLLKIKDIDTLNKIVINVAMPCMIFSTLYVADFSILPKLTTLPLVGLLVGPISGFLVYIILSIKKYPKKKKWALIMPVTMGNTAFLGFPVVLGVFGSVGLVRAIFYDISSLILFLSLSTILMFNFGGEIKDALKTLISFPTLWAVVIGIIFNILNVPIGGILNISINYLGSATIPLIMISLGLSLQFKGIKNNIKLTSLVSMIKLIFTPVLALAIMNIMGFSGLEYNVGITEASMPCSMLTLALAVEHDLDFRLTSNIIIISTFFSLLTIPILMGIL